MSIPPLRSEDALIIVDVQNDFCPGGALPVEECSGMIEVLNQWIAAAERAGSCIITSRDWHPVDHMSFENQGGSWPTHCVQNTTGAEFCKTLQLPTSTIVVSKGVKKAVENYSAFDGTGLAEMLRDRRVQRVWIGGLALDVCVRATALDARDAGLETYVIEEGTEGNRTSKTA